MRDLLKSFFLVMQWMLTVGRPPITYAEADAASAGLSAASPAAHPKTSGPALFGLSATIPGRVLSLFIIGLFLINVFSCSSKNDLPKGVLSKDEMAKILTEFYVKEARINALHLDQDSAKKLMEYYRYKYSGQMGVPDSTIDISYQYYLSHPAEMGEIYDQIIDTLALREQRTNINSGVKPVE